MQARRIALPWLFVTALGPPVCGQPPSTSTGRVPGSGLPIVAEHHYTVTARVRILLFWYARDDVARRKSSALSLLGTTLMMGSIWQMRIAGFTARIAWTALMLASTTAGGSNIRSRR